MVVELARPNFTTLPALTFDNADPSPLNDVAVHTPVANTSPSGLNVTPDPTFVVLFAVSVLVVSVVTIPVVAVKVVSIPVVALAVFVINEVTIPVGALNVVAVVIPENIALPSTLILAPTPGDAPTSIPSLAVIKPTESIFVTSSYVSVPPIVTLPL